jgi:hypothetical protein
MPVAPHPLNVHDARKDASLLLVLIIDLINRLIFLLILIIAHLRYRRRVGVCIEVRSHNLYLLLRKCGLDQGKGGDERVVLIDCQ